MTNLVLDINSSSFFLDNNVSTHNYKSAIIYKETQLGRASPYFRQSSICQAYAGLLCALEVDSTTPRNIC